MPTSFGVFRASAYQTGAGGTEHVALLMGHVRGEADVLTRLHSACFTGDVLDSLRCDCGAQLHDSLTRIAEEGLGILIYNPSHEGRGIGLFEKLRTYDLQNDGMDTVEANLALGHPADARDYRIEALILLDLGVSSVSRMTNNPDKVDQLRRHGVVVSRRVPLVSPSNRHNRAYLEAKKARLGHWLD